MTSRTPHAGPVDHGTASLLDLIAEDRIHADDRAVVTEGIHETARMNGGIVDPNRLRAWLRDERGECIVYPPTIGATVNALRRQGVLVEAGWVVTEGSTSGNNGRPARAYRLRLPATSPAGTAGALVEAPPSPPGAPAH